MSSSRPLGCRIDDPFWTEDLIWPGRPDTNTLQKLMTPSFHFGTMADSKTTVTPADCVR